MEFTHNTEELYIVVKPHRVTTRLYFFPFSVTLLSCIVIMQLFHLFKEKLVMEVKAARFPVRISSKFPLVFPSKLLIPALLLRLQSDFLFQQQSLSIHGWGVILLFTPHSYPGVETKVMLCEYTHLESISAASTACFPHSFFKL